MPRSLQSHDLRFLRLLRNTARKPSNDEDRQSRMALRRAVIYFVAELLTVAKLLVATDQLG